MLFLWQNVALEFQECDEIVLVPMVSGHLARPRSWEHTTRQPPHLSHAADSTTGPRIIVKCRNVDFLTAVLIELSV